MLGAVHVSAGESYIKASYVKADQQIYDLCILLWSIEGYFKLNANNLFCAQNNGLISLFLFVKV